MHNSEVSKKAFYKLFDSPDDLQVTENKKTHIIESYYNVDLDVSGEAIYNHVSAVWQYYVVDINL